jgi:hypothetical protein
MTDKQTITINGTEYTLADLPDSAKQQITNLRIADAELERLKMQTALAQTARNAYAQALAAALPATESTSDTQQH